MIIIINNSNRNKQIKDFLDYQKKKNQKKGINNNNICNRKTSVYTRKKNRNKTFPLYVTDNLLNYLKKINIKYINIFKIEELLKLIKSKGKITGVIITGSELRLSSQIPKKLLLPSLYALKYYHKKVPIMGLCFGFQIINNYFGGKLKSLDSFVKSKKKVVFNKNIIKYKNNSFSSNKFNDKYQFMHGDHVVSSGKCMIVISKDNTINAIKHKTLPIIGFQFHPELSYKGKKMIKEFFKN
jgi:anthranilate/para-aminobenzoate synthase component II